MSLRVIENNVIGVSSGLLKLSIPFHSNPIHVGNSYGNGTKF